MKKYLLFLVPSIILWISFYIPYYLNARLELVWWGFSYVVTVITLIMFSLVVAAEEVIKRGCKR